MTLEIRRSRPRRTPAGFAGLGVEAEAEHARARSRASYLSTLEAEQARAIADLHRRCPRRVVSRRYQVLVNGFAVSVPYARLPKLLDTRIATQVYPSRIVPTSS